MLDRNDVKVFFQIVPNEMDGKRSFLGTADRTNFKKKHDNLKKKPLFFFFAFLGI